MKEIFNQKVKPGSYKVMREILEFPNQTDYYIDDKICKVVAQFETKYPNIKKSMNRNIKIMYCLLLKY